MWYYTALTATGFIWVRYSFVINPVNISLAAVRLLFPMHQPNIHSDALLQVNFFVGSTGLGQLARIY